MNRNLLWTNLTILGFPSAHTEFQVKEAFFHAFTAGIGASHKLMEAVFSFLFQLKDERDFRERFQGCWPICDRTNQTKDFRNHVFKWLEQLKKEGQLPADFSPRRSDLDECRGDRFEKMLLVLSCHVLQALILKHGGGAKTSLPQALLVESHLVRKYPIDEKRRLLKTLHAHIQVKSGTFMRTLKKRAEFQKTLQQIAENLKRKHADLEILSQVQGKSDSSRDQEQLELSLKLPLVQLATTLEKYESALDDETVDVKLLETMVKSPVCRELDVSQLLKSISLPKEYAAVWDTLLQKEGISILDHSGRLDLLSLFKIFRLALCYHGYQRNLLSSDDAAFEVVKRAGLEKLVGEAVPLEAEKLKPFSDKIKSFLLQSCDVLDKAGKVKSTLEVHFRRVPADTSPIPDDLQPPTPPVLPEIDLLKSIPSLTTSEAKSVSLDAMSTPDAMAKYKHRLEANEIQTPSSARRQSKLLSTSKKMAAVPMSVPGSPALSLRKSIAQRSIDDKAIVKPAVVKKAPSIPVKESVKKASLDQIKEKLSSMKSRKENTNPVEQLSLRIANQALGDSSALETLKSPVKCLDETKLRAKKEIPRSPQEVKKASIPVTKTPLRPAARSSLRTPAAKIATPKTTARKQLRFNLAAETKSSPFNDGYNPAADMSVINPALFDMTMDLDMDDEMPPF